MEFQKLVDSFDMPSSVISVRKNEDGTCGEIRIVCGNEAYHRMMGPAFNDNMLYYELVPRDIKFEDFCFHAAVLKEKMHAYVPTKALNCWTDMTLVPLRSEREDIRYCQFLVETTEMAEADRMASVSVNNAEKVVELCIRLQQGDNFLKNVEDALRVIVREYSAEAARILLVDHEQKKALQYCGVVEDPSRPVWENSGTDLSYDLVCSWERMLGDSNIVLIKDENDLQTMGKSNPDWAQSLREHRIESVLMIPLQQERNVVGYLYMINFDVERALEIKELLELMSFFLGAEIANNLLLRRLEAISQLDPLTGVNNRRAMLQRMERISRQAEKQPYGVINIDLNGLKRINDHEGHEAGDRLLIQAGELMQKVFYHDDIFRTGGDEFIILAVNIARRTFEWKVKRLLRDAEKHNVSFAAGAFWSDGSDDIQSVFERVDALMYEDKKAYYDRNPATERRTIAGED